jgi:two-component system LytT family sensor kinase
MPESSLTIKPNLLKKYRLLWHILFWIWIYLLDVFIFGVGYKNVSMFIIYALLEMPGQLLFAYATMYWILPVFFQRLRFVEATIALLVIFYLTGFIGHYLFIATGNYPEPVPSLWDFPTICLRAFYCMLKSCIFIIFKLIIIWNKTQKKMDEMEKIRVESELKMLKDQVNPHFMFNTLNNLYGLIEKNPLQARESVMGLSGILHYMLYESNQSEVSMSKELKCINDYIELEKLRYAGNLSVALNIHDAMDDLRMAPLCLFPFVENSFKHGASEIVRDAWVNIDFSCYKDNFLFKIENSKGISPSLYKNGKGIGLYNVKRRLELLYGNDHQLQIIDSEERYLVVLKISLARMKDIMIKKNEVELSYR